MKSYKLIISKLIVALMALQILNLSIDTQNFQPPEPRNTLSYFNEMNSVVEFVTEKLITKRDTFPENKKQNKNGPDVRKHTTITTFFPAEQIGEEVNLSTPIDHTCFLPLIYSFIYTKTQLQPPKSC